MPIKNILDVDNTMMVAEIFYTKSTLHSIPLKF